MMEAQASEKFETRRRDSSAEIPGREQRKKGCVPTHHKNILLIPFVVQIWMNIDITMQ